MTQQPCSELVQTPKPDAPEPSVETIDPNDIIWDDDISNDLPAAARSVTVNPEGD